MRFRLPCAPQTRAVGLWRVVTPGRHYDDPRLLDREFLPAAPAPEMRGTPLVDDTAIERARARLALLRARL